ncbi:hypothetical protein QBC39DRAFT_420334 [Podospora conica]|nr:hypothetical protein QBC39DRAFT_420334 [Schizothecium conicum]
MAPAWLQASSIKFKEQHELVGFWLAHAARDAVSLQESPYPQILDSERLATPQPDGAGKIVVKLSDWEQLAEFIGTIDPLVYIPLRVRNSINSLIEMRVNQLIALDWAAGDEYPSRFLSTLHIYENVRRFLGIEPSDNTTEPVVELAHADTAARPPQIHPVFLAILAQLDDLPKTYELDREVSIEDGVLLYGMLVTDLDKVREAVKLVWLNIPHSGAGAHDPAVAAVVTDCAIKTAREIVEEMAFLFEALPLEYLASQWHALIAQARGLPDDLDLNTVYGVTDKSLFGTFMILQEFFKEPKHIGPHMQLPGWGDYGHYDPHQDRAAMSNQERITEDKAVLLDVVGELLAVTCLGMDEFPIEDLHDDDMDFIEPDPDEYTPLPKVKFPVADELMRLVEETCGSSARGSSKVTLPLVFAAQIFLDIHHAMRQNVETFYLVSMDEINRAVETLAEHFLLPSASNTHDGWTSADNRRVAKLLATTKWMFSDPIHALRRDPFMRHRGQSPVVHGLKPNLLLRTSPVLSGLLLFHFRAEMYFIGIEMAHTWGSVTNTWHIYNACQRRGMITGEFEDLEKAYALYQPIYFHLGPKPITAKECFEEYCNTVGLAETSFVPKVIPVKRDFAPFTRTFGKRYGSPTGDFELANLNNSYSESSGVSPEALVESIANQLQDERAEVSFPWLWMHRSCCDVLSKIGSRIAFSLRDVVQNECLEQFQGLGEQFPFIAGFILAAAKGRKEHPVDLNPLKRASDVIQVVIHSGRGSRILESLHWDSIADKPTTALDEHYILKTMRDQFKHHEIKELRDRGAPPSRFPKTYGLAPATEVEYRHVFMLERDDDF